MNRTCWRKDWFASSVAFGAGTGYFFKNYRRWESETFQHTVVQDVSELQESQQSKRTNQLSMANANRRRSSKG